MKLNDKQRLYLAAILSDIAKIVFAGIVIGQFIPAFKEDLNVTKIIYSLILSLVLLVSGILLLKGR
jgi:hypothetical protein